MAFFFLTYISFVNDVEKSCTLLYYKHDKEILRGAKMAD